jgi:predicted RND superfamily exporter protein
MLLHPVTSSPLWLVICWLAVWRISMLLCYEAGPFDIFSHLRVGLVRLGLNRLVGCFHCLSFWVSAAVVLVVYQVQPHSILLVLGIAGAVSLTERFFEGAANERKSDDV